MASLILTDVKLFVAGHDLSGQMNAVALDYSADMLDETTFGRTTRVNKGGLKSVVGNHQGLWDASSDSAPDPVLFPRIGADGTPVVISPDGAVGGLAYMMNAVAGEYSAGGNVGELMPFSMSMEGAGGQPLVRGALLHSGEATGAVTGTAFQLGSVSAIQRVYAALHVFSGTGAFIVKVQSASVQAFTTPNDRITLSTVATGTPIAAEWASTPGPITDTWWRIIATNPNTRNFAVAVGIQ